MDTKKYFAHFVDMVKDIPINTQDVSLSLIQHKDGIYVWRVAAGNVSYIMKHFENVEYRREIENYKTLISLGVPTLNVVAHTSCSILLQDIEDSMYRLGKPEDMSDPKIAATIAKWYKTLHEKGQHYKNLPQLYDECDCITPENIAMVIEVTKTSNLHVWQVINTNFGRIKSAAIGLPRTLTYNDFYYTNLAVASDGTSAIMYDYNMLGKGYVYGDIRNVCSSLGSEEARLAFKNAYGHLNENEALLDDIICTLQTLIVACGREKFPNWAAGALEMVKDGRLLMAVEDFLKE